MLTKGYNTVQALEGSLPPVAGLTPKEVDALENAVVSGSARRVRKAESAATGTGSSLEAATVVATGSKRTAVGPGGEAAAKKRRKRKPQYPKGFDPANPGPPPDPERWLAKWQRSDFKKKKERSANRRSTKVCTGFSLSPSCDLGTRLVLTEPQSE